MQTKETIYKEIDFLDQTRELCLSYEQISMMRMNTIKEGVLTTRNFYVDVTDVYYKVKRGYRKQILLIEKKREKIQKKNVKQKKKVSVMLSADNKLYGDILSKVFHHFIESIQKGESDIIIVGSLGKSMFDGADTKRPYTYVSIPHADNVLTLEDLKEVIGMLSQYEDIDVYFGRYESYINQKAVHMNITGDAVFGAELEETETTPFFFEPSLEKILQFFETQMLSALFKQTVFEGQLARYASRIGSMEEALHAIKKESVVMGMQKRKMLSQERDRKQNERIVQLFYRNQ